MVFKCKICGGSLDVKQGEKITVCEYCGVRQSIPKFIEPKIEEIYNRANSYLMHNEFDKAENLYNQILFEDNSNADAYWNVLMCRYGVTYVKDPKSGKYIPTCNRTLYTPIFNDENYKNALKYADDKQRELYTSDAQTIDKIQKGIIAVSKHEKPFDIFISYKEMSANGGRTKDSIAAQDLYEKLTAEGYKVFFSRITLEDKIGTEYEPYIYAALASSKVMITVCSSKKNIESVWVKNEWSRFLSFAGKDSTKTLIPLYFDMDKSELPDDFAHLSVYDMKTDGFEQDLIRGIKKLIPLPVMLLERRKKRNKILKRVGIAAAACVIIGVICSIPWFMKLPEYNAAMQLYYDKNYPEATWAFDELGGYRNSKDMKDKCELSWRKSLATVAPEGETINPNGALASGKMEIDEHGIFISAETDVFFYDGDTLISYDFESALHEDGIISNYFSIQETIDGGVSKIKSEKTYVYSDENWENIVQIITIDNVLIALRSDGKVIYRVQDDLSADMNWLSGLNQWENIIKCQYTSEYGQTIIVGIKADGTLCYIESGFSGDIGGGIFQYNKISPIEFEMLLEMEDVKNIDFQIASKSISDKQLYLNFAVLTRHNQIFTYYFGKVNNYQDETAVDISLVDYDLCTYILKDTGALVDIRTNNTILEDIVWIEDLAPGAMKAISRAGTVYYYRGGSVEKSENIKVAVYDEWIERMR